MKKKFMDFNPFFNKIINLNNKIEYIYLNYKTIKFANSLSFEDIFISYIIQSKKIFLENFFLNTGKIFIKNLILLKKLKLKYNFIINIYKPKLNLLNYYIKNYSLYGFYNNIILRKLCCNIRKLEPLENIILKSDFLITGQRKNQSLNRENLNHNKLNIKKNLIKCNILNNWSYKDIYYFIEKFNILIINLFNEGYLSLGCEPCTKIIYNYDNLRNGRWWWEKSFKKECGIHY